jgi:hypothetical protein
MEVNSKQKRKEESKQNQEDSTSLKGREISRYGVPGIRTMTKGKILQLGQGCRWASLGPMSSVALKV